MSGDSSWRPGQPLPSPLTWTGRDLTPVGAVAVALVEEALQKVDEEAAGAIPLWAQWQQSARAFLESRHEDQDELATLRSENAALRKEIDGREKDRQHLHNELAALIWQADVVLLTEAAKAAIATRLATTGVNICELETPDGRKLWLNP